MRSKYLIILLILIIMLGYLSCVSNDHRIYYELTYRERASNCGTNSISTIRHFELFPHFNGFHKYHAYFGIEKYRNAPLAGTELISSDNFLMEIADAKDEIHRAIEKLPFDNYTNFNTNWYEQSLNAGLEGLPYYNRSLSFSKYIDGKLIKRCNYFVAGSKDDPKYKSEIEEFINECVSISKKVGKEIKNNSSGKKQDDRMRTWLKEAIYESPEGAVRNH